MPEGLFGKVGAKICDLQDPVKKMSKSCENPNSSVFLTDDKDTIMRKFKRAVTDSDSQVRYDPAAKPGVSNLLSIYSVFADKSIEESEKQFRGVGYGDFKLAVGEAVANRLAPIQSEQAKLLADKSYLDGVMKDGAERAQAIARKTLSKVYKKMGLYQI